MWFRFTVTAPTVVEVSTCGASPTVYTGSSVSSLTRVAPISGTGCTEQFAAQPGTTYRIVAESSRERRLVPLLDRGGYALGLERDCRGQRPVVRGAPAAAAVVCGWTPSAMTPELVKKWSIASRGRCAGYVRPPGSPCVKASAASWSRGRGGTPSQCGFQRLGAHLEVEVAGQHQRAPSAELRQEVAELARAHDRLARQVRRGELKLLSVHVDAGEDRPTALAGTVDVPRRRSEQVEEAG